VLKKLKNFCEKIKIFDKNFLNFSTLVKLIELSDNKLLLKVPILILYPAYFIIMGTYAVLLFCLRSFFFVVK